MPTTKISDAFVRNVKLPKKDSGQTQITYLDNMERGLSLVLVVSYGGSKTFRALTYRNGKPQSRKLGTYPQMSVSDARAKAREYWQDPTKFETQAQTGSFQEIAENWIKRHVEASKLRSQSNIERMLKVYVYPQWKDRPFLEIRRREVNDLLDHVADKHGLTQADGVLAVIRGVMNWHQTRDENYTSPIVRGMRRNKNGKARTRILDHAEIRALWKAADDDGAFGALLKLCLLTAQRRKKVASMKRDDISDDGVWTIATLDREKGTAGQLTLPQVALDLIAAQPQIAGNPYVFAGSPRGRPHSPDRSGPPCFNSWSQHKSELDAKLKIKPWVIHDLRRTARSLMSEVGVRSEIAEQVLGHAIAGVEGVYDRYEYGPEKAEALKLLAAKIETIVNPPPANVVPMRDRRRKARRA